MKINISICKSIKLLKHSSNGYTNWDRFRAYKSQDKIPQFVALKIPHFF